MLPCIKIKLGVTEKLLHYIWEHHHFNFQDLRTVDGQAVEIIFSGIHNHNQGPDFLDARIRIANSLWAGAVELHVYSSEWEQHGHSDDPNYQQVILHVVWEHDKELVLNFPTLVLNGRISTILFERYRELMERDHFIPCAGKVAGLQNDLMQNWIRQVSIERMEVRVADIRQLLQENNRHWEEVFWWLVARNFGQKVNSTAFFNMARTIPLSILTRHKHQIIQVEALLFGQAGLLDHRYRENYPNLLIKEYRFLRKKYGLKKSFDPVYFLRMRPANFPTVRLAQLSMLIHQSSHLFSLARETDDLDTFMGYLQVTANDYWHYHYRFDESVSFRPKTLGGQMIRNLLANTIIPVLYAYGLEHASCSLKQKALQWFESIEAEDNSITRGMVNAGFENQHALHSQALVHLKRNYCDQRLCLQCAVGHGLLAASNERL